MLINYQIIEKRIREERRTKGISQEMLAEMTELSTQYISQIETAVRQASLRSLVSIANALDVSVDALLYGNRTKDIAEYCGEMELLMADCTAYEKRVLFEIALEIKRILKENRGLLGSKNLSMPFVKFLCFSILERRNAIIFLKRFAVITCPAKSIFIGNVGNAFI